MKNTVITFQEAKGREKLVMLTAYDYSTARIIDGISAEAGINALLVGDSLGNVMLGHKTPLTLTLEDIILYCSGAANAVNNTLLVCDLPFMSCHVSVEETLRNAGRLLAEGGAHAVKMENGGAFCHEVRALVQTGIPVMGHLGLTPQSVHAFGGYKVQGKTLAAAQKLLDDARALQEAGAFALVLECVPAPLATRVTRELSIPTIGIGAGPHCDGQVLVWQDMCGLLETTPKFVKKFGEVGAAMRAAFTAYAAEVRSGAFPDREHSYSVPDETIFDALK
ncbi:MAG: 3-methyl-2-oxobutanoate hydroxymethyltransferase [Desulfovibrio sp.]|jgi:3-methyl-2-oxobutanoate hydroxymethyltransferase|nr:3-methyl-2-oxobutanoate hydroxymethyltransferase [Desulfovibrio sp.]